MVPVALGPALALTAGAAAGIAFGASWQIVLSVMPLLLVWASVAWRERQCRITYATTVAAFGCCAFVLAANAREQSIDPPLRLALDRELPGFRVDDRDVPTGNRPVPARLLLTEDASLDENLATLRARVISVRPRKAWLPAAGGVVIGVGGSASAMRATEWRRGRIVEAPVTFRRPARYLNDGVSDFERDAALDGVSLLGTIKSAFSVEVVSPATVFGEFAADVRAYVRTAVVKYVAPHSTLSAAVVTAVLIGDRSGLPDDVRSRLQIAGTYHVIAISGGNIAILAAVLIVMLVPFGLAGRRAAGLTLLGLLAYAMVVTSGPSVWRATLVAVVYLVARLLDHRTAPWQATAVAAAIIAIEEPLDVRNVGFLLTFGATAALLAAAGTHRNDAGAPAARRWIWWLLMSVRASVAVEIVLLPVMAASFSRVTAAGLVLNVIAVPAMAIAQIAGLAVVTASALHPTAAMLAGWIAHLGATSILESARLVDVAPWLSLRVPPPSALIISAYYIGLAVAVFSRTRSRKVPGVVTSLTAGVLILVGPLSTADVSGLRLTMFDVGQGDALLLQVGRRGTTKADHERSAPPTLMIDTGGSPFGGSVDIGSRVLGPALWARDVSSVGALLLTHGDPDHIGGAPSMIADFGPRQLWEGIPVARAGSLHAVLTRAAEAGAVLEQRRQGEELRMGEARVLVLHPPAPDWERQRVRNDDSVVLEVVYGDVALLLTGDIGAEVERAIVPRLVPAKIRILKVAHHGSRTSTSGELLAAWRPQIALISCGRGNPFGHPAPEVITRLESIGAQIYRTDLDGQITVDTDGQHVNLTTFVGGIREPRRSR